MNRDALPILIIGAGPVGLAAAAHVLARDLVPLVVEAGPSAGTAMRRWGHVRMFSPWKYNVDAQAVELLERHGWERPDDEAYPTGGDLVARYLEPLATTPALAPYVHYHTRVVTVTRYAHDLMKDGARNAAPFLVRVVGPEGEQDILARAVIDASGTADRPGAVGAAGVPALGERAAADHIYYGIPDVLGVHRARYRGRRVLVVGSGHSALNALLELAQLADGDPAMHIVWAMRRPTIGQALGGSRDDQLVERGRLGARVRGLVEAGRLEVVTGFRVSRLTPTADGVVVSDGARELPAVDEIVAATGFRPDWSILAEVRLDLDPAVQSPRALAALIDPNVHSCGTVRPHGADELKHPETDLFVIGMKSYGRAPTFLLLTGYEQARSVVSAIAGDWEAARRVELVLPETGACSLDRDDAPAIACCGPTPEPASAGRGRVLALAGAAPSCCG